MDLFIQTGRTGRTGPVIHKIDQRGPKRVARRALDRLIVNCKQFRNCVDKAIKPFDWLRTGKVLHGKYIRL